MLLGVVEDSYRLAYHDGLTELPGRRALEEALQTLEGDYSIAMVDVDHFKRFNDRHGHKAGDEALRMVATELRKVRGGGRAYRYGGEEFAILFPGATPTTAREHLEVVRSAVASRKFALRAKDRPRKKPNSPKNADAAGPPDFGHGEHRSRRPERPPQHPGHRAPSGRPRALPGKGRGPQSGRLGGRHASRQKAVTLRELSPVS